MNIPRFKWTEDPYNLFRWVLKLMIWWHDDMIRCNTQENDKATTSNNWRTPGTSVSGRHNTPPLQEDLVLRSRMAPEGKRRGRGEVKLCCFSDNEWNQRTLRGWTNSRKEYNEGELGRKHSVRNEGKEHCENLEVEGKIYIENAPVEGGDQGIPNSNSTPVENNMNWIRIWQDEGILDENSNTLPPELLKEWHNG